jgi:hypothetical protein
MIDYRFTLVYKVTTLVLPDNEQPKNFSSVKSVIKRAFKTHGS